VVMLALVIAAGLGAFHALEPGHGKTMVAAYLVGARGTAWHALLLGLIVTASHTAGVYLLGGVTLYASRYVVPERIYPWLGVVSGLMIAGLGIVLFLRRYAGGHGHDHTHGHDHAHDHGHGHHHEHDDHPHDHQHGQHHDHALHHHGQDHTPGRVSLKQLFVLGVTGGIVPCPAALVVLLSTLSLGRVGFGLVLIVAFSLGLAAVLIATGILVVYARRLMARLQGEGLLITRWLPLTSAAVIIVVGLGMTTQALQAAGILQIRL
jgi:nickel/cobalt exporter